MMKLVSKIALALAISAVSASPMAYAKDEKPAKEAAQPKLKLSPEFAKASNPVILALNKKLTAKDAVAQSAEKKQNATAATALLPAAIAAIKSDDDKYQAATIVMTLAVTLQDVKLQRQAIPLFLESATTPAKDRPAYEFQQGLFAYSDKDFAKAEELMVGAYNKGYRSQDAEARIAALFVAQKKNAESLVWTERGIDAATKAGKPVDPLAYRSAFIAARDLKDASGIVKWGKEMVRSDPSSATYHDALLNFIVYSDYDNAELLDVMRLVRQTKSMRVLQEYSQYLQALDANRYPGEAVALLDEGMASGLISKNNTTYSQTYTDAKAAVPGLEKARAADADSAKASPRGYQSLLNGDALLSLGHNAEAIEMYNLALQKGGITDKDGKDQTDKVYTHLGVAKVRSGDFAGAKTDFQKINGALRKPIADYWLIYVDQQLAPAKPAPAKP